jgi:hypothetical protein
VENNFKDFNIKPASSKFIGDKISIAKIFNTEIKVVEYKIEDSTKKENSKCLTIQIKKQGVNRIIFTGSLTLMDQIKRVPKDKFPFITKIVMGDNDRFEFT